MSDKSFDAEATHICCYIRLNGWHSTLGDPVIGHGALYAIAQKDGFRIFVLGNDEDARILSRMPFLAAKYSELERELAAAQTALAQVRMDKAEFAALKAKLTLAKEAIRATAGLQRIAETERDQYKDKLAKYERAKMPPEPERLTMTRKLAAGGVATETVVAAHHYDALRIRLARFEAAQMPEFATEQIARLFHETYERLAPSFSYETRPDTKAFDPATPNGKLMIAVCEQVTESFRTCLAAQTVKLATARASERERCAKWLYDRLAVIRDDYSGDNEYYTLDELQHAAEQIRALKDAP